MAIAVQLDFRGATIDQYDQAIERMGLLPGGPAAREELFHLVIQTDAGFRVIDVWESREAFDHFFETRIRPVGPEVGMAEPPEIQVFEVRNYFVGQKWRR